MTATVYLVGTPPMPPACPVPWETWAVRPVAPTAVPDPPGEPGTAALVVHTPTVPPVWLPFLLLAARDAPAVALTTGPADLSGWAVVDLDRVPDPSGEVLRSLEWARIDARFRWLRDLGGEDFVRQLAGMVVEQIPATLETIRAAAAAGDAATAGRAAHQLKSVAGNVGATTMKVISARIESAPAAELAALSEALGAAWDRVAAKFQPAKL